MVSGTLAAIEAAGAGALEGEPSGTLGPVVRETYRPAGVDGS